VYSALVSILIGAIAGGVWTAFGLWKGWAMGIVLFVLVSFLAFFIISRILSKKLEPRFLAAQKQIQAGATQAAVQTLEGLLPMARWQIMLKGQIYAQMGCLQYTLGEDKAARVSLGKAARRSSEAQLFLAALQVRGKDIEQAKKTIEEAISFNKKQVILYNVLAWILLRDGDRPQAIAALLRSEKADKDSEATKDNLNRLQNGKKMNMKRFGMSWYALKLENPPASMRQQPPGAPRRGFRQKRKGGKR
jgi:tetratricopeptide (TPR) repeat protein